MDQKQPGYEFQYSGNAEFQWKQLCLEGDYEGSTSLNLPFSGLLQCLTLGLRSYFFLTAMPITSYLDDGKMNDDIIPVHLGFVVKVGIGATGFGALNVSCCFYIFLNFSNLSCVAQ
ncbi:F-box/LRR-repeat protein 5 [Frankliniella fusca]|uniref:F-box/LRR-repeat protein 5 n=1 Tax=Frankliniella fusca TaxID=407009 RepID=A0AAE1HX22_9NEOP|nr:F-box/LRR-repeat protein 5 [Frankliniella fusca]